MFGVAIIRWMRADGKAVWVKGQPTWRRFSVFAVAEPMAGEWDPDVANIAFCLHATKKGKVRTSYPYSDFVMTGFNHWGAVWGQTHGCKNNARTRSAIGFPYT